jgi:hypothetical protein
MADSKHMKLRAAGKAWAERPVDRNQPQPWQSKPVRTRKYEPTKTIRLRTGVQKGCMRNDDTAEGVQSEALYKKTWWQ